MAQESHPLIKLCFVASVASLLSGCPAPAVKPGPGTSAPSRPEIPPPPPPSAPAPAPAPRPSPPPREIRLSPATQSLVRRAHGLQAQGDLDGASATIDRALRIEPSNPLLWIELGRVQLVQSDAHQAESCARKALALSSGDRAAQAQAGQLLVEALRAQGRNQEAHEVQARPYMH